MTTELQRRWEEFEKTCEIRTLSETDRTMVRLSFYAGAAQVIEIITDRGIDDERAKQLIDEITAELEAIQRQHE